LTKTLSTTTVLKTVLFASNAPLVPSKGNGYVTLKLLEVTTVCAVTSVSKHPEFCALSSFINNV
jgi:hypothetical protein